MIAVQLENVSRIYRTDKIETIALEGINLTVDTGEFISIMGPSGCGKSTLLNIIGLLDSPTEGKVFLQEQELDKESLTQRAHFRNANLGFVFQSFQLIQSLDVEDNIALPLLYRKISAKERKERVTNVIERVGLSHRRHHFPSQLSGGQCQRVAIARALVGSPAIILADEPTGNLDTKMGAEIMNLLLELNQQDGRTIIMVTHNDEQAQKTQRIVRLLDGHQIA
ncbi:MAG: ABC transporter ATP-binding protein [Bacteroides sp.]